MFYHLTPPRFAYTKTCRLLFRSGTFRRGHTFLYLHVLRDILIVNCDAFNKPRKQFINIVG